MVLSVLYARGLEFKNRKKQSKTEKQFQSLVSGWPAALPPDNQGTDTAFPGNKDTCFSPARAQLQGPPRCPHMDPSGISADTEGKA